MTAAGEQLKRPSRWPYGLSLALLYVTFPLIWMGGLVTTYDAGMAVPDWPSTYGYNMFRYPLSSWVGGPWDLFVEHGHRLLGSLAGLLAIALVIVVHRCESRAWVRRFAWGALALVIVQGLLGGARVLLDQRTIAMVHGCVGPAFFMYAGAMACFTEPAWHNAQPTRSAAGAKLVRLLWFTLALGYLQLVLGANLRHIRVDAPPRVFYIMSIFHIAMALVIFAHAIAIVIRSRGSGVPKLVRGGCTRVGIFVLLQIHLGLAAWTVKYGWPTWLPAAPAFAAGYTIENEGLAQSMIVTAHMAVGSMILIHTLVAAVRGSRLVKAPESVPVSASVTMQECVA